MRFQVKIYDQDFSLAHTVLYSVDNTSIEVHKLAGLKGGKDTVLYKKTLSRSTSREIETWLSSSSFDTLKSAYRNEYVDDGQQMTFEILVDGRKKRIQVSNYYETHLASLVNLINKEIPTTLRMDYKK